MNLKEILGYSLGLFGFQAIVGLLNSYQAEFYGSVMGANLAAVGIIILVAKVVSAIFDPIVGNKIEGTNGKLGKFKPEYEGQMLLYLRYLNQNEKKSWEESPIGLILCSEGNTEHIEYLMLDENSPIKVAQYYTQLPDKKLLAAKLKKAIAIAREQSQAHKE